ncbi:hypothetical protein IJZ97_01950, partial [bacterium]|nr:hypothetical protein [bacterium]
GAKKACADIGMSLPAIGSWDSSSWTCNADSAEDTLCGIYNNRDEYGITSGWFWSSSEYSSRDACTVLFDNGYVGSHYKNLQDSVVCIGN